MESIFHLKKLLSQELIQDVSLETGIDPAFIEKDWFAVQLLMLLAKYQNDKDVHLIFSGGTSLSKGYNLIQRFSEDLDFFLKEPDDKPLSQGQRRYFRRNITDHIVQDKRFLINDDEVKRGDSYRFFKAPITYGGLFEQASLRAHLQLEMTFFKPKMPVEMRRIQSIVSSVVGNDPEVDMLCISPLETAGDKLSAFSWRVLVRDRNAKDDDATIIRHLHDLAALESVISEQQETFITTAKQSLEHDQANRGGNKIKQLSIQDRLFETLHVLKSDKLYRKEYEKFVMDMSYADEEGKIDFDGALAAFERVVNIYCSVG